MQILPLRIPAFILFCSCFYIPTFATPVNNAARVYDSIFVQFVGLAPDPQNIAPVHNVTIERDAGRFHLQDGTLYLCKPVEGRVCAAVYRGKGRFSMKPPTNVERQQLHRFFEKDSMDEEFTFLFLLFADTTAEELSRKLRFGKNEVHSSVEDNIESALDYLVDEEAGDFDDSFMNAFLEKEVNDLFYAHIGASDPLFFKVNPYFDEEVSFGRRNEQTREHVFESVSEFDTHGEYGSRGIDDPAHKNRIRTLGYTIESRVEDNLDFSASATVKFTPLANRQGWIQFELYDELEIDSMFWPSGVPAEFRRGKETTTLWVMSSTSLAPGQVCSLQVYYHGELLERNEFGWISIKSPSGWYPRYGYRTPTSFDLTFHTPSAMKFVSVGEPVSSVENDDVVSSRWITQVPTRNASFNIGYFEEYEIKENGIPPVTVLMTEIGHQQIGSALIQSGILSGANMEEQVGTDVANSVKFFQHVYGKCHVDRLYVTEIPYLHGEAFPGLIHLSWATYQLTGQSGEQEVFRAHEVAHQWWGIGVDFATYHDQWLSEGFSDYSGLWFMQTALKDNSKFFAMLEKWRDEIVSNRKFIFGKGQEAGPIWLGGRTHSSTTGGDYSLIIYKKGAWVVHMLRSMFLDLKTMNENKFTNLMRDFYASYVGKKATTADFERIVSKHAGEDMSWFFEQWVYDTAIPKYRFAYKVEKTPDGKYRVRCRVRQDNVPGKFRANVTLLIKFANEQYARVRSFVTGKETEFELPLMPMSPETIVFNDLHSVLCEVDTEKWDGSNRE